MDDTPRRVDPVTGDIAGRRPDDLDEVTARARETTRGYVAGERDDVDRRTRAIREEIEETRGEMSETIDAIQEKLKPRNIVANATERVKSATTERVREMADAAGDTAQQAMNYTREAASDIAGNVRQNPIPLAMIGLGALWLLSNRSNRPNRVTARSGSYRNDYESLRGDWDSGEDFGFMARVRNNPVPAALAGVGLSWLAFAGSGERNEYGRSASAYGERWSARGDEPWTDQPNVERTGESIADSATQLASRTREYASDAADSVRRTARRSQNQLQRMVRENPLLVGAGALMLGAAFGLAVPETETENEWMGETRDTLVGRARDLARDAADRVQDAAGSVADAAGRIAGNKTQP
jgi:ElaB/YqjD/DUF883 family membrane-anchored ribosome-binding protein